MLFRKIYSLWCAKNFSRYEDFFDIEMLITFSSGFAAVIGIVFGIITTTPPFTMQDKISSLQPNLAISLLYGGIAVGILDLLYGVFSRVKKYAIIPFAISEAIILGFYGLITTLPNQSLWLYIIGVIGSIAFAEIIFYADSQKPTHGDNTFSFTAKVKAECYIDVLFGWLLVGAVCTVGSQIEAITKYAIYPVTITLLIATIIGYIWLNSLKYRKKGETNTLQTNSDNSTKGVN